MTTILDTNALIYLLDDTKPLHQWAVERFSERKAAGPMLMCDIVYSEFSSGMPDIQATNEAILGLSVERIRYNDSALFSAARAFAHYRANGGQKNRVLPDFLIGALAESEAAPIITNDIGHYQTYFPTVELISPP